ncbi:MAG TPA: hypothetical protein VHN80_15505 [Kineosporiaceae bacterium]|nr:hypothetical protein [Kineosporiaceae bacterium]
MSIDITTEDLDLQTVELLPERAALGGGGGFNFANVHAFNAALAFNVHNHGPAIATAAAVQTIGIIQG